MFLGIKERGLYWCFTVKLDENFMTKTYAGDF